MGSTPEKGQGEGVRQERTRGPGARLCRVGGEEHFATGIDYPWLP